MKKFLKTTFMLVVILITNIGFCVTDYYWYGGNGYWDTTSLNWKINNTGDLVAFVEGNNAIFNYGTSTDYSVIVNTNINANNVTFNLINGKNIGISSSNNYTVNVANILTCNGDSDGSTFGGYLYITGNIFDNANITADRCSIRFIPTSTSSIFNFGNVMFGVKQNIYFNGNLVFNINCSTISEFDCYLRLSETGSYIINKNGAGTLASEAAIWNTAGTQDIQNPVLTINVLQGGFLPAFYTPYGDSCNINLYLSENTSLIADNDTTYDPTLEKVKMIKTKGYINCNTDKIIGYHQILPNMAKYVISVEKETISGTEYTFLYAKKSYVDGYFFMFK